MKHGTAALLILVVVSSLATPVGATQGSPVAQRDGTAGTCEFPATLTDATGTDVTLEQRPERIVALQPSDAQLVWELGGDDRVVGMAQTQYTSYLSGREGIENVKNTDGSINVEQVRALSPDLVLASNTTRSATVEKLRDVGLTVYHFEKVRAIEEIATNVETVGRLLGDCTTAEKRATEFRRDIEAVEQSVESADRRPAVLYYFFDFTTGANTHVHDLIETAGGRNVAAEGGRGGYYQLNSELVVDRDPEWIVYPSDATLPTDAPYTETTAMQRNQTVKLNYNYVSQPGPRIVQPLTKLAAALHPEAFADDTGTATTDQPRTTRTAVEPTTDGEATEMTTVTDTSGPGFGLLLTVVAFAATALLAIRRQ